MSRLEEILNLRKEAQQKYLETSLIETIDSIQTIINITQKRIDYLTRKIERLNRN